MDFPDTTISFFSRRSKIVQEFYSFLTENNIIYGFQFGFGKTFSTSHALINFTRNTRQDLEEGYIGCGLMYIYIAIVLAQKFIQENQQYSQRF